MEYRIRSRLILGISFLLISFSVGAQVSSKGLTPPGNTYRSFQDGSIARDSGLNQPLDLLNDFYPAIEVVVTQSDNIRRRSDVEEDDLRVLVSPSFAYRTNIGRHQFFVGYNGSFSFHDEFDSEDVDSNVLSARVGLDFNRSWDLDVFASLGNSFEERGISGSRPFDPIVDVGLDQGPDEVDFSSYGADLVYGRKLNKFKAVLGFEKLVTSFTNNGQGDDNDFGGRDRDVDSIHLDLDYSVWANTSVFARIQHFDTDFDRQLNSIDSEQTDFLIGARWAPSQSFSGVLGVGRTDRTLDDELREDFDGSIYYANLRYAFSPISVLQFAASRAVEETGDDIASFYVSELFALAWDYDISELLSFNAFFKVVDDDYGTGRQDEFTDWGIGLDYAWKNYLSVGIFYGEVDGESSIGAFDYQENYYGIRLRSDIRSLFSGSRKNSRRSREPDSFDYPKRTSRAQ